MVLCGFLEPADHGPAPGNRPGASGPKAKATLASPAPGRSTSGMRLHGEADREPTEMGRLIASVDTTGSPAVGRLQPSPPAATISARSLLLWFKLLAIELLDACVFARSANCSLFLVPDLPVPRPKTP